MNNQEASVVAHRKLPWEAGYSEPEDPEVLEAMSPCIQKNLRDVDPELEQVLEKADQLTMDSWEIPFKPAKRLSVALSELAGRTENSEIQTALTDYAVQIMKVQLDRLRAGSLKLSDPQLFWHATQIIKGLVVKNPKLAHEADILNKVAGCAQEYDSLSREAEETIPGGMSANECRRACNTLQGLLLEASPLPEKL